MLFPDMIPYASSDLKDPHLEIVAQLSAPSSITYSCNLIDPRAVHDLS